MHRLFLPLLILTSCSEYQVKKTAETGPGGSPEITVTPVFIDYGSFALGDVSGADVVTISNSGEGVLRISEAALSEPDGPYSVTALDETELLADESLDLVIEYEPTDVGIQRGQLVIRSNDTDQPAVPVELEAEVIEVTPPDSGTPRLLAAPEGHDFGVLPVGELEQQSFILTNVGDAQLTITDLRFITATSELTLDKQFATNGALPWTLAPDEQASIQVEYAPDDDILDHAEIVALSNDPESPETSIFATGNGRTFAGFSAGWYIFDDGLAHETTSSSAHPVDSHGDADLYWYEPSGAHGLLDSVDPEGDFAIMRDHVIAGAGGPTVVSGPMTFSSGSSLSTFAFATFTYVMCDFWIDPTDDPGRYTVHADAVDDGMQLMVNGTIVGRMNLGASPTSWSLADAGRPGEVNTLIVILVDDSASLRYLNNLAFYKDGVMVE
jgi:hypothetical protein